MLIRVSGREETLPPKFTNYGSIIMKLRYSCTGEKYAVRRSEKVDEPISNDGVFRIVYLLYDPSVGLETVFI